MIKGAVTRILPFSSVDGPGNRMVIFLQGCNFNCLYCHNPETIPICKKCKKGTYPSKPEGQAEETENCSTCGLQHREPEQKNAISYQWLTVGQVVGHYLKARDYISGVTISGGECTIQGAYLLKLCKQLKHQGAHVLLDTNGHIPVHLLESLMETVDGFMLDIKAFDDEAHKKLTGVSNVLTLQAFEKLLKASKMVEARTVILGNWEDSLATVEWVSKCLGKEAPDVLYRLIRYRKYGVRDQFLSQLIQPSDAELLHCKEIAQKNGAKNIIIT